MGRGGEERGGGVEGVLGVLTYPVDGICYTALSLRETSNGALGPNSKIMLVRARAQASATRARQHYPPNVLPPDVSGLQTHEHQTSHVTNQNSQFIKKISCLRQQSKIKKNKPTRARAYAGVNNRLKRV